MYFLLELIVLVRLTRGKKIERPYPLSHIAPIPPTTHSSRVALSLHSSSNPSDEMLCSAFLTYLSLSLVPFPPPTSKKKPEPTSTLEQLRRLHFAYYRRRHNNPPPENKQDLTASWTSVGTRRWQGAKDSTCCRSSDRLHLSPSMCSSRRRRRGTMSPPSPHRVRKMGAHCAPTTTGLPTCQAGEEA